MRECVVGAGGKASLYEALKGAVLDDTVVEMLHKSDYGKGTNHDTQMNLLPV